jgi:hypothetical protein
MGNQQFTVQGIAVAGEISGEQFACDLKACKGACCTMPGGLGAPLLKPETDEIVKAYPVISKYLSDEHRAAIVRQGLYEIRYGSYTTPCFNQRACVFVFYEEGIAKCAFEKAFHRGEIGWRKPISCHLFPIRVDYGWHERLRYESIHECDSARERGRNENVFLSDFLKDSLARAYGEGWYKEFQAAVSQARTPLKQSTQ